MQEINVEEKAIETYHNNLLFLQESHPLIFEQIDALSEAIENGDYKQRYALEYIDDYFDVFEIDKKKWLYGRSSNEHAILAANSIDYKKVGNLYETFNDVVISQEYSKELEEMDISQNSYSGAASLINYSNVHASKKSTTMKKLFKFIFLGTGLGFHIQKIHEKINSNVYFIIEDDLELFRLSLFCTDYEKIQEHGAKVIFSIFEEEDDFKNAMNLFLSSQFTYNHYIKYFHLLSHSDKKLISMQGVIAGQTYITFNYSALSTSLSRPLIHLKDNYKILNIGKTFNSDIFIKKPVLILGAGPSFGNNISWVKENYKKFILVAVTPLLAKLEELDIKPDIITHVHGFSDALVHVKRVKDMSFFESSIALFGAFTEPEFMKYFKKKNIYIFEGSSRYKRWNIGLTSSNIGSITYAIMMMLKTKNLYLLGLDFAVDQTTGKTHANAHNYNKSIQLQENQEVGGELIFNKTAIKTKGNFRDEVFTTLLMNSWKDQCNSLTTTYKSVNNNVFNLSDGAYIEDSTPLKLNDEMILTYKEIDKRSLYEEFRNIFDDNSENFLTKDEIINLKLRIDYCDNIIDILNKHSNIKHDNLHQYHYNLLGAFYEILAEERDVENSDIDYIISLYLQFVSGYIFDIINTKEIIDEQSLIKHLDKTVIPQIIRIVSFFKNSVDNYLHY